LLSTVSLVISLISFFLTSLAVVFTYRFNRITIRNTAKQQHQAILLEIDKMLIEHPELWTIYDDHPMSAITEETPELKAKNEAFIFFYLNFFDLVYEFYNKHIIKNRNDKETWRSWKDYIEYFLQGCSQARVIIQRSGRLYESDLSAFYLSIIEKSEPGGFS